MSLSKTEQNGDSISHNDTETRELIYTVPNVITVFRFILVPIAFSVLIQGTSDILAFILFALAGSTDFIDGQIARRTNTVSELGKMLDPLVDRALIAAGLLGLYMVGRLPLWILCVLIGRDLYLFAGLCYLKAHGARRLDVIFIGKLTTALLFVGFSGLILGWPEIAGLGWTQLSWLPGFNGAITYSWIWFVYVGMACSALTAAIYTITAVKELRSLHR